MFDENLDKVLYIDLNERKFWIEKKSGLFDKYLGGSGVGIHLLEENCPPGIDPLSKDNPIIFVIGSLGGLFPLASKTVAMFKSPHTDNLGESHCGGRSAVAIREAGYGAIVIKGASEIPAYLAIHGDEVFFRDASSIWGMANIFTVGRIIRESEPGAGLRTIMRIGQAGEKLITYACVTTETYRHFGRLGLGAVFGSKKLKGIVISGKRPIPISNAQEYKKIYEEIYHICCESAVMRKYHDLGTAENVTLLNLISGLPTRNLQQAKFENADNLSGETLAEKYLGRRLACSHCPVGCIHIATFRQPYPDEPYFYKTTMVSYDYEPIYSLGTMLGISDTEGFLQLMHEVETVGLDAMSTGVTLSWATESLEKGLISEKETLGVRLKWGDYKEYIRAVKMIVKQPNEFYLSLGKGVEYVAKKYGGLDYALSFGKNEMPGYHTGIGAYLTYLTGGRHSHLDSAGYALDQEMLGGKKLSTQEIIESLINEESWRQILSSLVVCFFARGIYKPELVVKALKIAGIDLTSDELNRLGKEILKKKYQFKIRQGKPTALFDLTKLRLPKRIFETDTPLGKLAKKDIENILQNYTKILLS